MRLSSVACVLLFQLCLYSCKTKEEKPAFVKFTVQVPAEGTKDVRILLADPVKLFTELSPVPVDSNGRGAAVMPLTRATFAQLQLGLEQHTIYLTPGDELSVFVDDDYHKPLRFSGKGAVVNNYMARSASLIKKIEYRDNQFMLALNDHDFNDRLQLMQRSLIDFHKRFIDTTSFNDEIKQLLSRRIDILIESKKQIYIRSHDVSGNNPVLTEKLSKIDSQLLSSRLLEYILMLNTHFQDNYFSPARALFTLDKKALKEKWPSYAFQQLNQRMDDKQSAEVYTAMLLGQFLSNGEHSKVIDSAFHSYVKAYPKNDYIATLEKDYKRLAALALGNPAPSFSGLTINGDVFNSASLSGKVVYIDLWASWCGSCRQEIPYSKALAKKFEKENVAFVYLSLYDTEEIWRDIVNRDPSWTGIHLFGVKNSDQKSVEDLFVVNGLPRYILIDRNSRIVDVNAYGPSSGDLIESQIRALL